MLKIVGVLRCVAGLTASREAPLGRRVLERIVAQKALELKGGCLNSMLLQVRVLQGVASRSVSLLLGFAGCVVGVKVRFCFTCIVRQAASCFQVFGAGWWVSKWGVLRCVHD